MFSPGGDSFLTRGCHNHTASIQQSHKISVYTTHGNQLHH